MIDDTRRQLRFVEEMEKQEHEKRENREKEALIRLSKSKGKDKEIIVEKARQVDYSLALSAVLENSLFSLFVFSKKICVAISHVLHDIFSSLMDFRNV